MLRTSRPLFAALLKLRFMLTETLACLVTLLTAFVALFVFIPALIRIVELSSTTITFFCRPFRILWWQFRWVLGQAVNLRFFGFLTQISSNQAFCQANGLRANKNARCIHRHLLHESSAAPWLLTCHTINVSQSDFTGNSYFSFGRFRLSGLIGNRHSSTRPLFNGVT